MRKDTPTCTYIYICAYRCVLVNQTGREYEKCPVYTRFRFKGIRCIETLLYYAMSIHVRATCCKFGTRQYSLPVCGMFSQPFLGALEESNTVATVRIVCRYGKPTATDIEVIAAAKMAQLDETIAALPDGFATLVGERGLKLSGGEKQRVAIARAFLQDPLILICDEATSALDTATEQGIMNSLDELAKGRTSIFVAHRLSTTKFCDTIFVVSEGKLVEQGSHSELLRLNGLYSSMWEMQSGVEDTLVQARDVLVPV